MSQTIIKARINDQSIQLVNLPLVVASGSKGVVQFQCEFDAKWDRYGKTAVFYRNEAEVYHVLLTDDIATVPHEVLAEAGFFYFGIMGQAENTRTTEVLRVTVAKGAITTATAEPAEPTPDIYQQIMARINELVAMRSLGGVSTFEFVDEYIAGEIKSNGAGAYISLTIDGLGLTGYGEHTTDWHRVPEACAPLGEIKLACSTPDFEVTLTPGDSVSSGIKLTRLSIRNLTNTYVEHYNATCVGVFPVASVFIAELADIRAAIDGAYETAGNAVRGQIGMVLGKIDELEVRFTSTILPAMLEE